MTAARKTGVSAQAEEAAITAQTAAEPSVLSKVIYSSLVGRTLSAHSFAEIRP
jgi:hypothetical protein